MADTYQLGMIGLGVMGRNLALNMSDHGIVVAGYDVSPDQVRNFNQNTTRHNIRAFETLKEFVTILEKPRIVMLLIPAGAVDEAIHDILPYLEQGDILIDGGNSHFIDIDRRAKIVADQGIHFLGVGISGGEAGARNGPSIMPGGPKNAYAHVQPIFEAIAAQVDNEPCVAYLGPRSAGHYVKMVHNGIEYGLMQLIAESYDIMKSGLGLSEEEMSHIYTDWNQTGFNSFLIEITAEILRQKEPTSGKPLLTVILDVAEQKGTGIWASEDSMKLRLPMPTIDTAVAMRDLSVFKKDRETLSRQLSGPKGHYEENPKLLLKQLEHALYVSMILTYSQGLSLLRAASKTYEYQLNLSTIAKIWRGGCIIRSAVLDAIAEAYQKVPDLSTLLLDRYFAHEISARQKDLRNLVMTAIGLGIPVPAFSASLAYYDAYRRDWLPANLIQAQRDFFGAHTYERIDEKGIFHTEWGQTLKEQTHAHQ
jgi:6-phosphogluconate dehydrogenase